MMNADLAAVLARLRQAADHTREGWLPSQWHRVEGGGPPRVSMVPIQSNMGTPAGSFEGLELAPGVDLVLRCALDLPAEWAAVPFDGQPLELVVSSVVPIELRVDDRLVFGDHLPPVACGPALTELLPAVRPGPNGELEARFRPPAHQLSAMSWIFLHFTTPALRARFDQLDLAWSQLTLAHALAVTDAERKAVATAAALVPDELVTPDGERLNEALQDVAAALEPLAGRMAAQRVHLVGHSHIDLAWLWTWKDTVEVIKRDVRSVVAMLDDYPEMTFTHSQPASYAVIRDQEPELFERIVHHISTGRWEPATMQWVEGDTNLASSEATARQLLEGVRFTRDELGVDPKVFLAPDTFGHAGNLPQLAASAGTQYYYHHRCNPGQNQPGGLMWPAYWWEGQDGTRLLAMSTPSYNGEITASSVTRAVLDTIAAGHEAGLQFYGVGDHGGGPTRQSLDRLRWLQAQPVFASLQCSTIAGYGRDLLQSGAALPTHRGESSTIFEGCYTTHGDTKRYNREGENLLTTAETLAAVAGRDHSLRLGEAWRRVLFNQFHDIIDGSSISAVYDDHADHFQEVSKSAAFVLDDVLGALEAGLPPGSVAVTNPLAFDRTDVVVLPGLRGAGSVVLVDENGHETPGQYTDNGLCFVAQVPPLATRCYRVETATRDHEAMSVRAAAGAADPDRYLVVDTPVFSATVRRDSGIFTSLVDHRSGRELVAFGMRRGSDYLDSARADLSLNVLQVLDEAGHDMSAWHLDEVQAEQSTLKGASTTVAEVGPVRTVLEVTHMIRASPVTQLITFYRDLHRIDVTTTMDWRETGSPHAGIPTLKAAFTASLPTAEAWFESPFGAVQRNGDGQEVPALRWASIGGSEYGLSILNDSKYGYDALGCRLRLSLVRAAYDPDPLPDSGSQVVRYSVVPHPGDWRQARVPQQAAAFNQPLIARVVQERPTSAGVAWRPSVSPGNSSVVIAALKMAQAGGGRVVRMYESTGQATSAVLGQLGPNARVWEANVVEDRQRELTVEHGQVELAFRPWQVLTLIVE